MNATFNISSFIEENAFLNIFCGVIWSVFCIFAEMDFTLNVSYLDKKLGL